MPTPEKTPAQEIRTRTVEFLIAAFGFVAGLAWNEAIKALIDAIVPFGAGGLVAKFAYAVIATLLLAVASWLLLRKKR